MKILVMNGPNINFLGIREKGIYGTDNYETLVNMIENKAKELGVEVEVFQSNHEGAVIDKIQEAYYTDVDGMITNVPGLVLATFYADCVPLFFIDPLHKAVGLSHSGWRGTVGKIGKVTVEKMTEEFQTDPSELYAAIGPSICQDCYEVSEDVIDQFREAFEEKYWDVLFYRKPDGKYQLNLWEANRRIFLDAGIKEERISMPGICTCCNPLFLYSHRASHGKRGNLGAFITVR